MLRRYSLDIAATAVRAGASVLLSLATASATAITAATAITTATAIANATATAIATVTTVAVATAAHGTAPSSEDSAFQLFLDELFLVHHHVATRRIPIDSLASLRHHRVPLPDAAIDTVIMVYSTAINTSHDVA